MQLQCIIYATLPPYYISIYSFNGRKKGKKQERLEDLVLDYETNGHLKYDDPAFPLSHCSILRSFQIIYGTNHTHALLDQ